jgi:elongation factor G
MHEVKGKEGGGATMDYMELERSAASPSAQPLPMSAGMITQLIFDTPGHVDFYH